MKKFIIITSINPKTEAVHKFEELHDWHVIVVGDKKSVKINSSKKLTFLSLEEQLSLDYEIVTKLPYNHYCRKNIGYLYALQNGAEVIYDTDDDNFPFENWSLMPWQCNLLAKSASKFINIYKYFSDEKIWPRGFPIDEILSLEPFTVSEVDSELTIGVWQGLANIEPDVDAIYRLTINKKVDFNDNSPIAIEKKLYSPINSQNTFWNKKAFPFLFLPCTVNSRYTDIMRGYIAQRLLWEEGLHVGFTKPNVYQDRNYHNFMVDFIDEIEMYQGVKPLVDILNIVKLGSNPISNLKRVYNALYKAGLISNTEIEFCNAWLSDFNNLNATID